MKYFLLAILLLVFAVVVGCVRTPTSARESALPKPKIEARAPSVVQELQAKVALKLPLRNPRIVVFKNERRLELYSGESMVRTYRVGLGLNPVPDKQRQGDRATPEGAFYIFTKNDKSAFYLSLGISYPNIEDAERGLRDGLISRRQRDAIVNAINRKGTPPQNTALGGDIYIHGNGASSDWTWGCVALENADIRELFDAVPLGTPVTIKP
jgi:murein L,D-transpeptidase YafK